MVMPDKKVLFNEINNGLYYHDMEDHDLVLLTHSGRKPIIILPHITVRG